MNENISKISKRLEKPLEVLGLALLLTAAQIAVFHIVFTERLFGYFNGLYYGFIKNINVVYTGYIKLLEAIFGFSNTVALFDYMQKVFILIFAVNLGYFTISWYLRNKSESD